MEGPELPATASSGSRGPGQNFADGILSSSLLQGSRDLANGASQEASGFEHWLSVGGADALSEPPGLRQPERSRSSVDTLLQQGVWEEDVPDRGGGSCGSQESLPPQGRRTLDSLVQEHWKAQASLPRDWPAAQEESIRQMEFLSACRELHASSGLGKLRSSVVMALERVPVWGDPALAVEHPSCRVLLPGQCVISDSMIAVKDTRLSRLYMGGWVASKGEEVLVELQDLELGPWWYQVVSQEVMEARQVPNHDARACGGVVLSPNEVCVVGLRCLVQGTRFLQLADGRGWLVESLPLGEMGALQPTLLECSSAHGLGAGMPLGSYKADIVLPADAGTGLEMGLWRYRLCGRPVVALGSRLYGTHVKPGQDIIVHMRLPAHSKVSILNRMWLRLSDGRGWIPEVDDEGRPLVQLVGRVSPLRSVGGPEDIAYVPVGRIFENWAANVS
mmetsp:Transcript_15600/g.33147  ORF Transcript_15600/g.33147 Transcript_15600/m.33147 type:complete len:447 (-) Transcript_15600:134-1474(-)|eukprot:CAMPEP_0180708516 /NCGR_PEP_ID=MMETSP1038_2-20121128/9280_1 /TAXON_ID=632150 /ORGANISM="Azadinium spinosum, Strain 3D9" /LENGTH=446 /DNA_ID=CAMNT_0022740519 /DNA_START=39 /DNA_END=1379 /DNA_ORIENTATION=+